MRILAINDVSCIGKCSLTTALPIISACGVECNVLPTAILSTHTGGFSGYTFRDLTEDLGGILHHWKSLHIQFDYIISGYLGSMAQIDLVAQIKEEFLAENGKFIVDPVMGDGGKLYTGFTAEYVEKMRELCKKADYILPNITEASFLADTPYPITKENAQETLDKLLDLCPMPIITGILDEQEISVRFTNRKGTAYSFSHDNVEGTFHGAGDVFAAAFVGCLARGLHVANSIYLASDFTAASIRRSAVEVPDKRYGLNFEMEIFPFLEKLNSMQ